MFPRYTPISSIPGLSPDDLGVIGSISPDQTDDATVERNDYAHGDAAMRRLCLAIAALSLEWCCLPVSVDAAEQTVFSKEELKIYFATHQRRYPDDGNIYRKLITAFPGREVFTADEITAVTEPKTSQQFDYETNKQKDRPKQILADGFSPEQVTAEFNAFKKHHPQANDLWAILIRKYGKQPWYHGYEIRDVEVNGEAAKKVTAYRVDPDPVAPIVQQILTRDGFKGLRVRESWRDVLFDEDPTQKDKENQTLGDLVGATLSYAREGKADTDTWTAIGAIILPWEKNFALSQDLSLRRLDLAPSISVNRVATNAKDASGESDSLLFRLGGYADVQLASGPSTGLEIHAAGVFATDTGFEARLPGFELDLEPRVNFLPFPLGYKKVWVRKAELQNDHSDNSCFDTQLRFWLHFEGGDAQDTGDTWDTTKGGFARLGPALQLQAEWPKLVFGRSLSLTALGSYFASFSGSSEHNSYFKIAVVYDLHKDVERNQKVSLNLNYEKGGLNLTKENVDNITVGLGVLF